MILKNYVGVGTLKLKTKDIPAVRASLLKQQEGIDPITGLPIEVPCLDHDHKTGKVRGVLDRKCNAWEGKVRNAFIRVGLAKTCLLYTSPSPRD